MNCLQPSSIFFSRFLLNVSFACLLVWSGASPCAAAVVIEVDDAFINADGTGTVDVWISSTATDNVDFASYEFAITNIGTPGSALAFSYPPDFSEDGIGGPNGYLFFDDTAGIDYDDLNSTASTYIGFDGTASFTGVNVSTAQRLLVRLDLQHDLGPGQTAAMAAGEQFRITLQDNGFTFFDNSNEDPLSIDASSFDPLVGGGLITVQNATAVPEPSSLAIFALGVAGTWSYRRRKWKKERLTAAHSRV